MKLLLAAFLAAHALIHVSYLTPAPAQTAGGPDATLLDADWMVCLGVTRQVTAGRVECPMRAGLPVDARAACEGCRHMTWRHDERDRRPQCSTQAVTTSKG